MKLVTFLSLPVLASSLVFVAGCGGAPGKTTTTTTTQQGTTDPAPVAATPKENGIGSPSPDAVPPITPVVYTDEQIAAINGAANRGEIDQGKFAADTSKNAKIKRFGAMMVTHHTDANSKETVIFQKAHITPEESPMSTQMTNDSSKLVDSWKGMTGPEFDRAYIDAQVKEHTAILDAIDTKLLPAVKNADLKNDLTSMRAKVDGHLKEAQAIQKGLPTPVAAK